MFEEHLPPEIRYLYVDDSLRLHAWQVLTATNQIREAIDQGHWDGRSSRDWFMEMHAIHMGKWLNMDPLPDPYQRIIPIFEGSDTLEASYQFYTSLYEREYGADFQTDQIRRFEMNMVRSYGLLGIPLASLPIVEQHFFNKLDTFLLQGDYKKLSDEQKTAFALCCAMIVDLIHVKSDGNGRTSEDFMVQLQRVLFDGEMASVKTWHDHGLRVSGIEDYVAYQYQEMIADTQDGMQARAEAMNLFRKSLQVDLTLQYQQSSALTLTNELLQNNPEIVTGFFVGLIDQLIDRPQEFFDTEYREHCFDYVWSALLQQTIGKPYVYKSIPYEAADPEYWRLAIDMGTT